MKMVATFIKMCDKCGGSTLHKIYRKNDQYVVTCVACVRRELEGKCPNTPK